MIVLSLVVFLVALVALVKGSDWLLDGAEKIGLAAGLSPFVVGVVITGVGTSLPELVSSVVAVWQGLPEVPIANAVGSNIANIWLVVGLSAVIGRRLTVTKNLIDLDLPLLAASTVLFLATVVDGILTAREAVFLLLGYAIYLLYSVKHQDEVDPQAVKTEDFIESKSLWQRIKDMGEGLDPNVPRITLKDMIFLSFGFVALTLGAKYLIDSLIDLSSGLGIGVGAISIVAVAVGTSLPELLISAKAAFRGKSEIALGNIFGSNVFNILVVTGLPALFAPLTIDSAVFAIGLPGLILATMLFVISGISKRIHNWEGGLYLLLYLMFIGKTFGIL